MVNTTAIKVLRYNHSENKFYAPLYFAVFCAEHHDTPSTTTNLQLQCVLC